MGIVTNQPEGLPSTDALKSVPDPENHALQIPAIDATFVKFTGTSGDLLDNPPSQDQERTYIVKARCSGYDIRTRADGERRVTAVMEMTECFERGRVPIVDEKQGSLFGQNGEATAQATGDGEDPEGVGESEEEAGDPADASNVYSPNFSG